MANGRDLQPIVSGPKLDELAETEQMSKALVRQCFMKSPDGGVFIKRAGLLFKTERKFKGVGYSVLTEIPSEEEMKRLRSMLGLKEGEPAAIIKGVVRTREGDEWTDYGTATADNTNKMTASYLLEMACTRATNRAMRIATVCGFTSVEELPPAGGRQPFRPAPVVPTYDGDGVPGPGYNEEEDDDSQPDEGVEEHVPDPEPVRDVRSQRLSEEDYNAMREKLITKMGVAPWHLMNHLKKHYGIQTMAQTTYAMRDEVVEKAENGYFRRDEP